MQKGELTLRVGNEVVHFNLDKILTGYDVDTENCNVVDNSSPISFDLISLIVTFSILSMKRR